MNISESQPFKLFPVNKAQDNAYSYYSSNPLLQFEWNENFGRVIDPKSLRLCGKLRIFNKDASDGAGNPISGGQQPANRFDLNAPAGAQDADEYVAYCDDRVSVSSVISNISVANLKGNLFEQCKQYNRGLASQMGVTSSYKDLCSLYQQTFASQPNNDGISRACSGDIPFAVSLRTGFLQNPAPLMLNNGGLQISISLASTPNVIYGLNADKFVYEIRDVYMTGKYLVLEQPLAPERSAMDYNAYYNYLNVLNSGNDHSNLNLNLSRVNFIYQNFIPAAWNNNFAYNGFSTPTLLELNGAAYEEKKMNEVSFNRGAVRYPFNYDLNFEKSNTAGCFQALRSREFLNAIYDFSDNRNCSISPHTEDIATMVEPGANQPVLVTPQHADQGLVNQWQYNAGAAWSRAGNPEKAANVFGIGLRLDNLYIDESADYSRASYNYAIKSELNTTTNNTNVFALANTQVFADQMGNLVASN